MKGQLSKEIEVTVPATDIWEVYGSLELGKLIPKLMPDILRDVEVVEGDGGVGTVLKLTLPPGIPGLSYYKEKFTKVDNEKRHKETEVVEGGYLELGFTLYRITLQIIEKDSESSIIKSTIDYEVNDDSADNAAFVSTKPLETIAQVIGKYLMEKKAV
ncbi:Bet v I domain [Macleaya cordata]|uniref:Bet v I domain n=1 Tax=Macleaya cordata TaxID=56857 RepID=A0A200PXK2_MACCD|nr:Bet v I domain [Macleaya cordata]